MSSSALGSILLVPGDALLDDLPRPYTRHQASCSRKSTGFLDSGRNFETRISRRWRKRSAYAGSGWRIQPKLMMGSPPGWPRPVLIDAVVNRTELAMPPSITIEMAKGFSLY